MTSLKHLLTRFNKKIWISSITLFLAVILLMWWINNVALQINSFNPPVNAINISTKTTIHISFNQPISKNTTVFPLSLTPPVSGTIQWQHQALTFTPSTLLNSNTTYTVTFTPSLVSQQNYLLNNPIQWQFHTRLPHILYVAPDKDGNDQLFMVDVLGENISSLTSQPYGIWDYTLSPDGSTIVYTALNQSDPENNTRTDLWTIALDDTIALNSNQNHQLLACPQAQCMGATWSPDGQQLIYARREPPNPARLWLLDIATGHTEQLFDDYQILGFAPQWHPSKQWINYVSPLEKGVRIYNLTDNSTFLVSSQMGESAVWSPQGDSLLLTAVKMQDEQYVVQLLRVDLASNQVTNLSGAGEVDDGAPIWSPDGKQIAFGRKPPRVGMGKQIWIMHSDGGNPHYLTDEPHIHNVPFAWSPDGQNILLQRINLKTPNTQPAIWILNIATGNLKLVTTPGRQPSWLP